jgi:hypothetical protein
LKRLLITAVVLGLAWAQSPSEYLGMVLGQTATFQGGWVRWDGSDSMNAVTVDTESVADTFLYNTYDALGVWTAHHMTGDTIADTSYVDTFFNDASWLRGRFHITDTVVRDAYYARTPFVIGDKWSAGTQGKYVDDLDGDGMPDTMEIRADTFFVEDSETIIVPAGSFQTYRLRRDMVGAAIYLSSPMVDSVNINITAHLWWSPGNWMVKDTSHSDIVITIFGTPYPITEDDWRELFTLQAVEERASVKPVDLVSASVSRGIFLLSRPESGLLEVSVYDPAGRLALKTSTDKGSRMMVNTGALTPGVYFLRASLDGREVMAEKVVKR